MDVTDLVYSRLVLVTGKGGVGKTSVAAALGRLAAAQGRRTVVVELDAHQPSLTRVFGRVPGHAPVEVDEHLSVCNVDWYQALQEWVEQIVAVPRLARLILANRLVHSFLDATPGSREVVLLARLRVLRARFDLVVVDMPASGHARSLLAVPGTVLRLFGSGPMQAQGRQFLELLTDAGTHTVLVAIPEEMVVNETEETWQALREAVPGLSIPLVVLNRASRPTLTSSERALVERLQAVAPTPAALDLVQAGRWEAALELATGQAMERLERLDAELLEIPRLSREGGDASVVQLLAAALARSARSPTRGARR